MPADETISRPRDLWRIAVPAYGPSILASIGAGAVLPVLAITAVQLGASTGLAALVVGMMGVGALVAALPAGALVARIGERRALVWAGLGEAAAMALALLATQVWMLALAVTFLGAATAVFHLARQSYLTAAVPLALRARALSTLGGMHRIGVFIGPLLGALAIWAGGDNLAMAYLLGAAAALCSVVLVLLSADLTAGHEQIERAQRPDRVLRVIAEHRRVLVLLGTGVMTVAAARACRVSLIPLWATESIGLTAAQTSLVFAIAGAVDMLLFYPAGAIMDRYGRVWTAVPAVTILGVGFLVLPLTGSLAALSAVAVVMAIGNGLGSGIVMTLGADAAPDRGRPQFLAGWRLVTDIGGSGGPLLVSGVAAVASLAAASLTIGGLTLAGAGWLARWVPPFAPPAPARASVPGS